MFRGRNYSFARALHTTQGVTKGASLVDACDMNATNRWTGRRTLLNSAVTWACTQGPFNKGLENQLQADNGVQPYLALLNIDYQVVI